MSLTSRQDHGESEAAGPSESLLITTSSFLPFQHHQLLWLPLIEDITRADVSETLGPWLVKEEPLQMVSQNGESTSASDVLFFSLQAQPTMHETLRLEAAARKVGLLPHPRGVSKKIELPAMRAHVLGGAGSQREPVFAPRTLLCLWHPEAEASSVAVQALSLIPGDVIRRFRTRVVGLGCASRDGNTNVQDALFLWTDGNSTLPLGDAGKGHSAAAAARSPRESAASRPPVLHLSAPPEAFYALLNHLGVYFAPYFVIVGGDGHVAWSGSPTRIDAPHLSERLSEALADAFPMEEALAKSPYAKHTAVPKAKGRRPRNGR